MADLRIQQNTEAEKDTHLLECFHDTGIISFLLSENYSIVSGRKGTGKTALARFLEANHDAYGIASASRLSCRDIALGSRLSRSEREDSVLSYLLLRTIQELLRKNVLSNSDYWKDYLTHLGLQGVADYKSFIATRKTEKAGFSLGALFGKVEASVENERERANFPENTQMLFNELVVSVPEKGTHFVFVDDLTDFLDEVAEESLSESIDLLRGLLFRLDSWNSTAITQNTGLRYIALVRDDIFDYMQGSNTNKLKTSALKLAWNEKDFASLLIKRLPYFRDNLEAALGNPINSLKAQFPDEIFAEVLNNFDTKRYASNFYAYMVAISFNRPRDFLMFCHAMRERLSEKHAAEISNIAAAEIEYSDYFNGEIRDELFLAGRILKVNLSEDQLNELIDILASKDGFNHNFLKVALGKYLGEKASLGNKKIEAFISQLWWYGILGFREDKKSPLIHFRYMSGAPLLLAQLKEYLYYLHRGLWWFAKKRKRGAL